jgi:hypothetical protein
MFISAQFHDIAWATDWRLKNLSRASGPNQCGAGYKGFMCSECEDEWNKIGGLCVPCNGFNMPMLITYVLSSWGVALILLHKSIKDTISREDIKDMYVQSHLTPQRAPKYYIILYNFSSDGARSISTRRSSSTWRASARSYG